LAHFQPFTSTRALCKNLSARGVWGDQQPQFLFSDPSFTNNRTSHRNLSSASGEISSPAFLFWDVLSHWKWHVESLGTVSHSPSVVTMAVSCIVFEIKRDIGRKSRFFYTLLHSTRQRPPPLSGFFPSEY